MHPVPRRVPASLGLALVAIAGFPGCATHTEKPDEAKIVVPDQYVMVDAPVGSHMKRRVKLSELRQPGITPTDTRVVTAETDTTILPPTAAEVDPMASKPGN